MSKLEIEQIAREFGTGGWQTLEDMIRFGMKISEVERAHCINICDRVSKQTVLASDDYMEGREMGATVCANYIRLRINNDQE